MIPTANEQIKNSFKETNPVFNMMNENVVAEGFAKIVEKKSSTAALP